MARDPKRSVKTAERGLFDAMDRLSRIDRMGDPLANRNRIMKWEIFVPVLDRIPWTEAKAPGGRPAFHPMFMFSILVLQSLYGLADEQTQFQVLDHRSFHRFPAITDAAVHDGQALDLLTREGDPETSLDSGYGGQPCADVLASKSIAAQACEKGVRGKPLTRAQKRSSRRKSKRRSRVEHVFGFMTVSMKAMY